ncbi:MAG: YlzJ-like family protein [Planctomycetia bacterium]|nr:YlzJ-like family protein [Planctomycetia bacterium]
MMYSIAPIYGLELPVEYEQIEYNGFEVLACKTPGGYILERLYSTNPQDFLREDLQPGKLLENALIKQASQ